MCLGRQMIFVVDALLGFGSVNPNRQTPFAGSPCFQPGLETGVLLCTSFSVDKLVLGVEDGKYLLALLFVLGLLLVLVWAVLLVLALAMVWVVALAMVLVAALAMVWVVALVLVLDMVGSTRTNQQTETQDFEQCSRGLQLQMKIRQHPRQYKRS